jgi:hypothetical protein
MIEAMMPLKGDVSSLSASAKRYDDDGGVGD